MSESPTVPRVYHFGPSTEHVGGMATVISTLVGERLGAERASAVATWRPGSHLASGLLTLRAGALVLRLPRDAAVHVHISEGGSFVRKAVILAAARSRRLVRVLSIHGPAFSAFAARRPRLVRSVLNLASAITVLSDTDLRLVRELAPGVHSELVFNPVPARPALVPASATAELVLFAGEVGLRKGADVLSRAWPAVAHARPTARCVMVGPATDLRIEDRERLQVRGAVDAAEIRRLLCEARVVALPSRGEALPMILLEAMAAGRPFVTTPVGGIGALRGCGLIVPAGDHEALAAALIELLENPQRAGSLAARGQELCRRRMDPQAVAVLLGRLYRQPDAVASPSTGADPRTARVRARATSTRQ